MMCCVETNIGISWHEPRLQAFPNLHLLIYGSDPKNSGLIHVMVYQEFRLMSSPSSWVLDSCLSGTATRF